MQNVANHHKPSTNIFMYLLPFGSNIKYFFYIFGKKTFHLFSSKRALLKNYLQ